jgi:hypothetical protein
MKRGIAFAALALVGCASAGPVPNATGPTTLRSLPLGVRLEYMREAVVWSPIDTATLDLRAGPEGGR